MADIDIRKNSSHPLDGGKSIYMFDALFAKEIPCQINELIQLSILLDSDDEQLAKSKILEEAEKDSLINVPFSAMPGY